MQQLFRRMIFSRSLYLALVFGFISSSLGVSSYAAPTVNFKPVAVADFYTTNEDTAKTVTAPGILSNDFDLNSDPLTAELVTGPSHGTLDFRVDGSFTYTPAANYFGFDSFTYKAKDSNNALSNNTATVNLTVVAVNDPPVAFDESYSTNEDTTLGVSVGDGILANDTNVEGDTLTALLVAGPSHGVLTLIPDGSFTYIPDPNFAGVDSFTYEARDLLDARSAVTTVSLTVTGLNDAPVAVANSYGTAEDSALTVDAASGLLSNDSDVENDALTAVVVTQPSHGTLTLNLDGSFFYTPHNNYNGPDSFTYGASDGLLLSNITSVNLTITAVNDAPTTVVDAFSTAEDNSLTVAAPGLLANDSDAENDVFTAVWVSGPSHGTVVLNVDGSFTYTPTLNYNGPDSFAYQADDGMDQSVMTAVNLTITPVNDAPLALPNNYSTARDIPLPISAAAGVLLNDSDIDGDSLTSVWVSGPSHGTLTLNADGAFTYTPGNLYVGLDSFSYYATDGVANTNPVVVNLTVNPVQNSAPTTTGDSYSIPEDTTLVVAIPGVLANDTDVDANPFTARLVSSPSHGLLGLNADGSFIYTPTANYKGADSFTYQATDGADDSGVTTVNLTVTSVNDAPTAMADNYTTAEDTALTVAATGVLANDADIDADALTAVVVNGPSHGTIKLNLNGSFTYTPTADYNGADSFTYQANDGLTNSPASTVNLIINPVNDAPTAMADSYSMPEDTLLTIAAAGVLSNDTDVDADLLTAVVVKAVSHGKVILNLDGSFVYSPTLNYQGPDSFTYQASDGVDDSGLITVSLTVLPVNDAPLALADNYRTVQDKGLLVVAPGILDNDRDTEQDSLTAQVVKQPDHGALTLRLDGSFRYTPTLGYYGRDSFTYRATDGALFSASTGVSLTVIGKPVAINDAAGSFQGAAVIISVLTNDIDMAGDGLSVINVTQPAHGEAAITALGKTLIYLPVAGFHGLDSFFYTVQDSNGNTDTALVAVVVSDKAAATEAPQIGAVKMVTATQLAFTGDQVSVNVALPTDVYTAPLGLKDIFFLAFTQQISDTSKAEQAPNGFLFGNLLLDLSAYLNNTRLDDFHFATPVTLTITYDPALLGTLAPETLTLLYWNGTAWSSDGIVVLGRDVVNHRLVVSLAHLSEFALFASIPTAIPPSREPDQRLQLYLPLITHRNK